MVQQPLLNRPGHQYDDEWKPSEGNTDELEDAYNSPDAEYPDGHPSKENKSLSDEELAESENSASAEGDTSAGTKKSEDESDDEESGLYKKGKKKAKGPVTRKRAIIGGVVGVLAAGTIGVSTFLSGPLKIIHFGQLLKSFHFSAQEDASSDRMSKIARYIRHRNKPERTRLGALGNLYANRIEKKFNKSGIQSAYGDRFGYLDGYVIDPTNVPRDSDIGDIMNREWGTADTETINNNVREAVARHYNLDASKISVDPDGRLRIDSSELGYFKNRKLIKNLMVTAGMDGLAGSMRARIMTRRSGISLHPIRKLDKKILDTVDKRLAKWKEDRQKRLDNGETSARGIDAQDTVDEDGDGTADSASEDAQRASAETHATAEEARAADAEVRSGASSPDGPMAKLRSSTSLKIAGGVSAAIGIICTLKGLSDNFDHIKYLNLVLPMMRLGMEYISLSDQIKNGKDVDLEQLSFYSEQLYQAATEISNTTDKGTVTEKIPASSAFAARSIQAELGRPLTGEDVPDEVRLNKDGNLIGRVVNNIPGINGICDAANSLFGQIAQGAIDFLGGPFSAVTGFAFGQTIAPKLLGGFVNWLAGHPVDLTNLAGAPLGGVVNYGARLASNDSYMAAGGRELSGTEEIEITMHRMKSEKERLADKSFFARMFDVYDSGSLIAKAMDLTPASVDEGGQMFASMLSNISGLVNSPIRLASATLSNSNVSAATTYDYGFPEFGFSINELNDQKYQNPFENSEKALAALNGSRGGDYISRAEKCFGVKLSADGSSLTSTENGPNYTDVVNDASCRDEGTEWTHIRFFIFDTQIMESQACFEGDDESCTSIGFGDASASTTGSAASTTVTDKRQDTSGMACAPTGLTGESVVAVGDGSIRIKLCDYGGVRGVNASWSSQMSQLIAAAKADGVELAGGGFRTAAKQIELRTTNGCPDVFTSPASSCRVPTAIPGTSNHELGLAIDYSTITSQCFGRGATTCPGNSSWDWLTANASRFGVKQLGSEAWHWSVDGR